MIIRFSYRAGQNDQFAPGCFDASVGKPLMFNGREANVLSYEIADDGSEVSFDCEVPEHAVPQFPLMWGRPPETIHPVWPAETYYPLILG